MYSNTIKKNVVKTLAESMKYVNPVMTDVLNEIASDYERRMEVDEDLLISLSECV